MFKGRTEGQFAEQGVKMEVERTSHEPMSTVLSVDTRFKGSLSFEKSLKIEGEFEGEISTPGTLYVGKDAKIKAEIKVGNIYVDGSIVGNVTAGDKVELHNTAKLVGDIKAAKLVVEEGAILAGHCEVSMKAPEKEGTKGIGGLLEKTPVHSGLK